MALTIRELRRHLDPAANGTIAFNMTGDVDIARRIVLDLTMSGISGNGDAPPPVSARGHIHVYSAADGVWHEVETETFYALTQLYSEVPIIKHVKKRGGQYDEVTLRLKMSGPRMREILKCALVNPDVLDADFFESRRAGLAFANGFVTVTEHSPELEDHAPDNRATIAMPFDYDADAECSEWLDVLDRIFEPDEDKAEKKQALQEFAGACVAGIAADYARCLVLVGEGENGKSTVAETISEFLFPRDYVTHVPPQSWGREYNLSAMRRARINVASEIPESDILNSAAFKGVVTGDRVTARDPYGRPYGFTPIAGHLFSANSLPGTIDNSHGFWRRFLVLTFNRDFGLDPDRDTKSGIKGRLRREAPGIMAWALAGASRLIRRGGYTLPKSHGAALREWRLDEDSVAAFADDCCRDTEQRYGATLGDLHAAFKRWCKGRGRKPVTDRKLAKRLRQLGKKQDRTEGGARFGMLILPELEWKNWRRPSHEDF